MDKKELTSISWNELRRPAAHLLMTGLAEDGSHLWNVVRKPDRTFWEVTATVSFAPTGETLRVDTGDQILDLKKLAQYEECYGQFQRKSAENEGKTVPRLELEKT